MSSEPGARVYDNGWFGDDPDAHLLDKATDLPWAVVPLVLNDAVIGEIVVDNALTKHRITGDALDYLNAMSAVAVGAIANRRSIQFLSLNSLPVLYGSLAADFQRANVIKRLLVYLTCAEALGFSRGILLEWRDRPDRLIYRASIGSLTEERFRYSAEVALNLRLADILQDAPNLYDIEIDLKLNDFQIDLSDSFARELLRGVARTELALPSAGSQGSQQAWAQDLASRIDEGEVLTAPLRIESRVLGLIVVDRRWQQQPLRDVDVMALRIFAQLASQILEQSDLQQRNARQQTDLEWENIAHYAAHECRGPVDDIENLLWGIEHNDVPKLLEKVRKIRKAVGRLKLFIDDFLSLAQASNINPQPIRLASVLKEVGEVLGLGARDVNYSIECPSDLTVLGDRERLLTCFRELVTNALYWFDKEEKRIHIDVNTPSVAVTPLSLDTSLRYAVIHVEDNGSGIARGDEDRIYDPKFTRRRGKGGTGIGLYMVKRIVEEHKGMVTQYGGPGHGTTFAIHLPLVSEQSDGEALHVSDDTNFHGGT